MIRLFDVENDDIKPTEHCWAISWLRDIMTAFPDPKVYMKAYRYIFYMTCPDKDLNPYRDMAEIDKSEEILRMLALEPRDGIFPDDMKIDTAITEARKLYASPTNEAYMAAKTMLEKLKRSFQTEEISWGGKDATGPALVAAMEKLPKLIQAYADTEVKLNEEIKGRARGNQLMSDDIDDL